ncbi:DHS-like NAD/FAD-binding domain-containing protein [Pholiota conissans]|uniref:DHS-like NAD/FAD-binding domain-containing protein n=1 Tax=Pholiota conissans TaxID=109636 RepID=A0A9P5YRS1_9AGAR|nr:DHS-like NAD/FAD-binding domain-containing protein [Pholiota conissans]
MTVFLPLDPATELPSQPAFLAAAANPVTQLAKVVQAIMKAKRIVVICGAGISVQAGIPDFRSSEGLFQTIKRDNPREAMSSGKELFDVSVFNSEQKTSLFCQMIAQLSDLSQTAEPTSFHHVLRALDDRGRLLRVYTQNIDAIEQKCGLSFGVPDFEGKRLKSRSKGKAKAVDDSNIAISDVQPVASTSRLSSPPVETPRCIPLHGTLQSMHCQICNHSFPLLDYIPALVAGQPPPCPECTSLETTRQLVGKRPRGIGKLRPSVVLYNEAHKDGEGVGDVVQKDLIGSSKGKGRSGADLLLVVGTSLKVPGTKRMVREFAKAVRARSSSSKEENCTPGASTSAYGLATPTPSPRRSPMSDEEPTAIPKAVYLNLDFPVPTREWEGVFDAWIQGDAQEFADILHAEIEKEAKAKEMALEKKRRKEEEAALAARPEHELPDFARMEEDGRAGSFAGTTASATAKRKLYTLQATPSKKKSKHSMPPSPPYTPVGSKRSRSSGMPFRDDDSDSQMGELPSHPPPSKLTVRIPPRPFRPSEKYLRANPQDFRSFKGRNLTRSITPSIMVDDDDDILYEW